MQGIISILLILLAFQAKAEFTVLIIDTGLSSERTELTKYVDKTYPFEYQDYHGHGTHVSSIILKHACPGVKVIPCNFFKKGRELVSEIKCLAYGLQVKPDVVNMSLSGKVYSKAEHDFLKEYEKLNIPVHVALGNEGLRLGKKVNNKKFKSYPASLNLKNIVKIGALEDNKLASYTNIDTNVKYYPGNLIGADLKAGKTKLLRGTSQATAYYTGLKVKEYCKKQLTRP